MRDLLKFKLLITVAVIACLASVCLASFSRQTYPLTIKDESGRAIKLPKAPERIISCMPSITEMLFKLGLGKKVVGVTENCNYPLDAKKIEKVGRDQMNLEKIVSLKPDLIVMLGSAQPSDIKYLRSFGLPVFVLDPKTVNGVMHSIALLGDACDRQHAAYAVTEDFQRKLEWVAARAGKAGGKKPRVFVEVWHRPLITAAGGTFLNDVIEKAGGINIAKKAKGPYPEYSFEKLIAEDPDAIIIPGQNVPTSEAIYKDGKWMKLRAVQNGRVLFIDADIMSRPGPRMILAVDQIASFLYGTEVKNEN